MKQHLNYIILHDGKQYHLFERLGDVPFEAYNTEKAIVSTDSLDEILKNRNRFLSKSWESLPENLGKSKLKSLGISEVPRWDIEEKPYEVILNDA